MLIIACSSQESNQYPKVVRSQIHSSPFRSKKNGKIPRLVASQVNELSFVQWIDSLRLIMIYLPPFKVRLLFSTPPLGLDLEVNLSLSPSQSSSQMFFSKQAAACTPRLISQRRNSLDLCSLLVSVLIVYNGLINNGAEKAWGQGFKVCPVRC